MNTLTTAIVFLVIGIVIGMVVTAAIVVWYIKDPLYQPNPISQGELHADTGLKLFSNGVMLEPRGDSSTNPFSEPE